MQGGSEGMGRCWGAAPCGGARAVDGRNQEENARDRRRPLHRHRPRGHVQYRARCPLRVHRPVEQAGAHATGRGEAPANGEDPRARPLVPQEPARAAGGGGQHLPVELPHHPQLPGYHPGAGCGVRGGAEALRDHPPVDGPAVRVRRRRPRARRGLPPRHGPRHGGRRAPDHRGGRGGPHRLHGRGPYCGGAVRAAADPRVPGAGGERPGGGPGGG
mmetsp:Transcript_24514/g.59497  ORF Transcript_24514/g.59497 Transcript_24514/m.59497 type:complete len:216 (+) Transcript_24514:121-768(+)